MTSDAGPVFLALRCLLSERPQCADFGPEELGVLLFFHGWLYNVPEAWEVEAAMEVLDVERGAA